MVEVGIAAPCDECPHGHHDDCENPESLRQTRETGGWCWVDVCCCGWKCDETGE